MKVWLFHETLQPNYGNLFGLFLSKNSGYTSFIWSFLQFAIGLSQVVENSIAAALSQQITTACNRPVDRPLRTCQNRQVQGERTHPDIGLLTTGFNRSVADGNVIQ
jgi:hypothetical protein